MMIQGIQRGIEQCPPLKLMALTASVTAIGTVMATQWLHRKQWNWGTKFKWLATSIPTVNQKLQKELLNIEAEIEKKYPENGEVCEKLPETAWDMDKIMKRLENVSGTMRSGCNSGAIYHHGDEMDELIRQVCYLARRTNPLHMDLCPLIRQLEAEIIRMTLTLFKGDPSTIGDLTSGGTDSIRHAVYTARERAKALGLGADWEMVVPMTAHPSFAKAANEYGIRIRKVEVHKKTYQVNLEAMKKAITSRTILVVGSLPAYPHGIPDNIDAIAEMLTSVDPKGRIGLHIDACLGGFVVPWMERAGFGNDVGTRYGFDIKRVTSISADTHKYGYGEKGTSVVMYRDQENWRKHQIFVDTDWPGGIYATPTMAGSRSGRDIAALWAVMAYMGANGYVEETRKIIKTTRKLTEAIKENPYLEIMGDPKMMVVAFCSKQPEEMNIYDLKEEMKKEGWDISGLQNPAGLHFCVTAVQGNDPNFVTTFQTKLNECVQRVLAYPQEKKGKSGDAVMYGLNQQFGTRMFFDVIARHFWDVMRRTSSKQTFRQDIP